MPTHRTALNDGQLAEFVSAGTKALILIADQIGPDLAHNWARNGEAMQRAFLQVLVPPSESPAPKKRQTVLSINRVTPFNPAEFIGRGWTIWKGPADGDGLSGEEDQDARSLALNELDTTKILLEYCLQGSEEEISGEETLRRLKAAGRIRLDAGILQTFWEDKSLIPELFRKKIRGYVAYIFFDGTGLRSPDGRRGTLCLYFGAGGCHWGYYWLDYGRSARVQSAVLANI